MHSLNAFFGKQYITHKMFNCYTAEYDGSDQSNLVSFILNKHQVHVRYYALNAAVNKHLDKAILDASFIFVYNHGHIWGVRKHNGRHYKVDSIGGVTNFNIQSLRSTKNVGLLVPVTMQHEWGLQVSAIRSTLKSNNAESSESLCRYLRELHKKRDVLGDLEVPLGVAISIMETRFAVKNGAEFVRIKALIQAYNEFVSQFTNKRYNDIELIITYIPSIVSVLLSL
jgi:hypothetical protein